MKHNNVTLITSDDGSRWLHQSYSDGELDDVFDAIVITTEPSSLNVRQHHDSPWATFNCQFRNGNKHRVFEYSPYDRTLLVDIDYFIMNDNLDYIFETDTPLAMYTDAHNVDAEPSKLYERYINEIGIPMIWSTVVYFDKSEHSKQFFDLWAHIADSYQYYSFLYDFPHKLFRTDYCVSIAIHILNGAQPGNYSSNFKDQFLINSSQYDDIVKFKGPDDIILLVNDRVENWVNCITRIEKTNLHIMNKRSIMRHYDDILQVLK